MTTNDEMLSRAMRLARIALAFGRVERATYHEDGRRPETDTDHTVMLGLIACELAPAHLDRARVAAFALVHDLPEADPNAGDTQTLTITPEGMAAKRAREDAARARITADLGAGSWVAEMMATYEEQREPEARFVRLVDKILPKLTHAFNGCAAAKALTDREGFHRSLANQLHDLSAKYPEFVDALALLRAAMQHSESCWSDESARRETTIHDALRAQLAQVTAERDALRAIVEGRTAPPSDDEIEAHEAAGGLWRWVATIDGEVVPGLSGDACEAFRGGAFASFVSRRRGVVYAETWWALDAQGRPCAWPVVGEVQR